MVDRRDALPGLILTSLLMGNCRMITEYLFDESKSIALLTASSVSYSVEKNQQLSRVLACDARKMGFGFMFVDRQWSFGSGDARQLVQDRGVLVIGSQKECDFAVRLSWLASAYDQPGLFIKDKNGSRIIYLESSMEQATLPTVFNLHGY